MLLINVTTTLPGQPPTYVSHIYWQSGEAPGHGRAEGDSLEAMLVEGRKRGVQEMLARVEADTDVLMDNGVRINPGLQEMARRATAAKAAAEAGPRCGAGHSLTWRSEGAAGLGCDGRCRRKIRRGAGLWSCAECDFVRGCGGLRHVRGVQRGIGGGAGGGSRGAGGGHEGRGA